MAGTLYCIQRYFTGIHMAMGTPYRVRRKPSNLNMKNVRIR